ncbi:MAG: leucine-rich repeat domain-containing protein [Oscillospiraceae bacterium]|nr:leucine-rich repeat domain-containing protein [Oscillospiraceae bacterium]
MQYTAAICTQCGARLEVDKTKEAAVCSHCGSAFIVEKAVSNYNAQINAGVVNKTVNIYGEGREDFVVRAGTLERYNGVSSEIVIPDGVKAIGDECFKNSRITSITIPDGVISIGRQAFWNCDSLTTVDLPDSVTNIGDYAFANCDKLETVNLPDSVSSIGVGAFACCKSLADEILDGLSRDIEKSTLRGMKLRGHKKEEGGLITAIIIAIIFFCIFFIRG